MKLRIPALSMTACFLVFFYAGNITMNKMQLSFNTSSLTVDLFQLLREDELVLVWYDS